MGDHIKSSSCCPSAEAALFVLPFPLATDPNAKESRWGSGGGLTYLIENLGTCNHGAEKKSSKGMNRTNKQDKNKHSKKTKAGVGDREGTGDRYQGRRRVKSALAIVPSDEPGRRTSIPVRTYKTAISKLPFTSEQAKIRGVKPFSLSQLVGPGI
jgi:hypothetical protein